jgi:hypothetical protein
MIRLLEPSSKIQGVTGQVKLHVPQQDELFLFFPNLASMGPGRTVFSFLKVATREKLARKEKGEWDREQMLDSVYKEAASDISISKFIHSETSTQ